MAVFVKAVQDPERIGVDVAARDRMIRSRHDGRVRHHPYATIATVRLAVMGCLILAVAAPASAARKPDPLLAAREFYNAGQFDRAIEAATEAAANPSEVSSARLVMGRSRLERYRKTSVASDLVDARADLRAVDARALDPRERVELQVGLAVLLFFDDSYGAAAELLDPLLDVSSTLAPDAHDRALEWWATALDRQAQSAASADRTQIYARMIDRMERELRRDAVSAPAGYWLAAAARGSGDLERAQAAAEASWVRATLKPDRAEALRTDLDKLVTQAIIPERANKTPARERQDRIAKLTDEWDKFKAAWSR